MSATPSSFPPVRACIFDVDGLLINSEDIYTEIYNRILRSYGKEGVPWHIKAQIQSIGRPGILKLIAWANLPITYPEWTSQEAIHHHLFTQSAPLPGVPTLLSTLATRTDPKIHIAIASSARTKTFALKTGHLPEITEPFPPELRVFGDDPKMGEARKKPAPDVFLLALERVNEMMRAKGEKEVKEAECLVFEDSVAGVEAGRRAGMRVCWVPQVGLRGIYKGREREVLEGKASADDGDGRLKGAEEFGVGAERAQQGESREGEKRIHSEDGWAEMILSLENFDYERYGIRLR